MPAPGSGWALEKGKAWASLADWDRESRSLVRWEPRLTPAEQDEHEDDDDYRDEDADCHPAFEDRACDSAPAEGDRHQRE